MEWCKLYANLDDDPRVQAAEDAAENSAWLLVQAIMYCTRIAETTDTPGLVPRTQIPRFGGRNTDQRVKALVSEHLLIPQDAGYLLDPDVWNPDRNLDGSADRKRAADRNRMASRRAAERARRDLEASASRDSRATGSATVAANSRATGSATVAAQSRGEENYPPNPPQSGGNASRCTRHTRRRRGCPDCELPPLAPVPDKCPDCNPSRRLENNDGVDTGPCPVCHPSAVRPA